MRFAWPLTGRSEEMQAIEAAMSAPDVAGIVVCGAAGVGKSRIARETLSLAASRGAETNWAIGTSSARGVPLGAFASWVGTAGADNLQVVHRVIRSLTSAAPAIPVVIGVDDAHLIDDLSTFVLQQIVQRGAAKIVLTIRDGEPVPRAIRDIWTGSQFDRLDLQPLSRDETAALVTATLGGSLDPDAEGRLWRLTRGNVLYLCNIVEQEVGDGRLTQKHGLWTWTGEPVVSSTLVELIESRMGAFPCRVSDVIDTVAVGEPVELRALQRITDPEAVEAADTRGLITLDSVEGNVEVRLAHPLYGEVRRRRAPSTKLRRLRGLVAGELAASRNCDDMRNVVRRGALSLDSDVEPDPDLLVRAAQGAVWLADLPLADRLAAAAMRGGAGAEANFIRAHALSWLSRGEEADAVLAGASTTEFSVAEHARLAFLRATNMLWTLADPAGAKQLIDNVSQAHASIDAFRTVYWAAAGKPQSALSAAKNLELTSLPDMVAAVTAWAIAVAAGDAGHTDRAVAAADAGYAVTNRAFDAAHMRFVVADGHIGALVLSGRLAEASDAAERSQKTSADLHGAAQLFSTALAGRAALGGGDLRAACSLLEPVVELLFGSGETNGFGYRYQLSLTIALAMRGLTKEAEAALATLENRRHPSWRYLAYEHALAEAWVAASEGAVTQAIGTMLSAAETAQLNGQLAAEVLCLQTATQFGSHATAVRLRELEAAVEGPRVGVAARFAEALNTHDAAELDDVSREFERMGDLVAAVDSAAHAAATYRQQSMRGSALRCAARAEELACRSGAKTPALDRAAEPLPLTDREREIVQLIGEGVSNRAVATRLCVSVRTVEGHIYRAMTKTGTTSREELAALLPRHHPT